MREVRAQPRLWECVRLGQAQPVLVALRQRTRSFPQSHAVKHPLEFAEASARRSVCLSCSELCARTSGFFKRSTSYKTTCSSIFQVSSCLRQRVGNRISFTVEV